MTKNIAVILLSLLSANCLGQLNPVYNFNATQVNNDVYINFTTRTGISCLGAEVQRSSDSINFYNIYSFPGVCGSTTADVTYDLTDNSPLPNADNFYRINLLSQGYSDVLKIHFLNLSEIKPVVYPNPFTDKTGVYFLNPLQSEYLFELFSSDGKLITTFETKGNYFSLSRDNLAAGIYSLRSTKKNGTVSSTQLVIY
ncbi:MAG: T9SS type A sorting domain-containing protein [Bacteroidia bacterium]